MALILTDTQKVTVTFAAKTALDRPARVDGIPQWSTSNPAVCTITPASDGLSAVLKATATGTSQISVTADADLGAGVRNITATGDVEVRPSEAVSVGITFGTPEEQ